MGGSDGIERVLRRDRLVTVAALLAIVAISWAYILAGAGTGMSALGMSSLQAALGPEGVEMSGAMAAMATPAAWSANYAALMFLMWWIMMVAMMLPSAAPMILLYGAVARRTSPGAAPWTTAAFGAGYLLAWAAFSVVAVALQWHLERRGLLSPMMSSTSAGLAAGILIFAGLYQLTPLKQACLRHCRGPVQFLTRYWRPGTGGAAAMGLRHGVYCLGCCWGLMAILFFGGIMNLYWIVGLALLVLLEKLMPLGRALSVATGCLLLAWGALFLRAALVAA